MRSRYSAYAYQLPLYIIQTTHPKNPRYQENKSEWTKDILQFCRETKFESLEVLEFTDGAIQAYVTFHAHLSQKGSDVSFIERSEFLKEEGRWYYYDGRHEDK
jgi:SEC-C motif-containing protein